MLRFLVVTCRVQEIFCASSSTSWPVIHVLWTKWQVFTTRNQAVNLTLSPTDGWKTVANVKLLIALFQSRLIFPDWLDSSEMISFWHLMNIWTLNNTVQFVWMGHVVTDLLFQHSFVFLFLIIYYPASSEEKKKKTHKIDSASEWINVSCWSRICLSKIVNAADGFLFDSSRNLTTSLLN